MTCFACDFLGCLAALVARCLQGNIQAPNSNLAVIRWSVTFNSSDEVPSPRKTIPCMPARLNEDFRSNGVSGMLSVLVAFRRGTIVDFAERQVEVLRAWNMTSYITKNAPGDT